MPWTADSTTVTADSTLFTADGYGPSGGYSLSVDALAFTVGAPAIGLRLARRLTVASATLALSLPGVSLRAARRLPVTAAGFSLALPAIGLARGRRLAVDAATFALSAPAVGLRIARRLPVAAATFALTTPAVGLARGRRLAVDPVSFAVAAPVLGLRIGRRLAVSGAAYATNLPPVGLSVSGGSEIIETLTRWALGRASGGAVSGRRSGGFVETRGMAARKDWTFDVGEDWVVTLSCRDAAGAPLPVTGGSATWKLARNGAEIASASGEILDGPAGLVRFLMPKAVTGALAAGEASYTMRVVAEGGQTTDQLFGRIAVRPTEFDA